MAPGNRRPGLTTIGSLVQSPAPTAEPLQREPEHFLQIRLVAGALSDVSASFPGRYGFTGLDIRPTIGSEREHAANDVRFRLEAQ